MFCDAYSIYCIRFKTLISASGSSLTPLIARFMGPTWGPSGADRTQVGPMLAPWTLLSGTLRPSQNSRHFAADISKCSSLYEKGCIYYKMSRKFVCNGPINTKSALVQVMALSNDEKHLLIWSWKKLMIAFSVMQVTLRRRFQLE